MSVNNIHLPFLAALASALACRMKLIKHILEIYAATTLTPSHPLPFFWGGRHLVYDCKIAGDMGASMFTRL